LFYIREGFFVSTLDKVDMPQDFISMLGRIEASNPQEVIERLQKMFVGIMRLNAEDLIVAYQTVKTVGESTRAIDKPGVQNLLQVMEAQMTHLCDQSGLDFVHKMNLERRFNAIKKKRGIFDR
jgi:hypothetical protein